MLLDKRIRKELKRLNVPYKIKKTRDHYILEVPNKPSIVIGGNHPSGRDNLVGFSLRAIRRLRDGYSND